MGKEKKTSQLIGNKKASQQLSHDANTLFGSSKLFALIFPLRSSKHSARLRYVVIL